jgi:mannitol 2-dehydrogenase
MTSLSLATLNDLPSDILRPHYDRASLSAGIVHIGLGNFHRAHQSWYLHRLMQQGLAYDWAIVGAGVRSNDEDMRKALKAQDYLTTLVELDPGGISAEIVGPMIDFVPVQDGNGPLIEQLAMPNIRIVALTVTESGYYFDSVSNTFDPTHPDIEFDLAYPEQPRTAFGAIVAALKLRKARGFGPFSVMSCDNLQGNGNIVRQTIVSLARLSDSVLADWIDESCCFPNSMVDCIVPATTENERELVQKLGIKDAAPVSHENFRQWVIEDNFCAGRPDWDKAGAEFSDRVHDFETMKISILNGGHQAIAAAAEILGITSISEAMAHPLIHAFFRKVEEQEILPYVAAVPGMTPQAYLDQIDCRFSNKRIIDTTRRVAFDGSGRQPTFVLPSLRDALSQNGPIDGLALVSAIWARYCFGLREDGKKIDANDPQWDRLNKTAKDARKTPRRWLEMDFIYGDLVKNPKFVSAFNTWLGLIYDTGLENTLRQYLKGN